MDPVTLYDAEGRSVTVRSRTTVTNLLRSGYRDAPPAEVVVFTPPGEPVEVFDPGAHTVGEVKAFLAEHPDLADGVVAAERAGRNRAGLTGG